LALPVAGDENDLLTRLKNVRGAGEFGSLNGSNGQEDAPRHGKQGPLNMRTICRKRNQKKGEEKKKSRVLQNTLPFAIRYLL
jgi:hypothetical protein